jgi:hypothetical protein
MPPLPSRARLPLYALPLATLALLGSTYLVAPDFYLKYVLAFMQREKQVVEIVTFLCAISSSVCLSIACRRLWKARRRVPVGGGAMIIGVIATAAFFFAGEELSWGQDWIGWQTPDEFVPHTPQTNLHNIETLPIRVQTLASLFLVTMFFALPLAWRLDAGKKLPQSWEPAIAEGPVIFTMVVGFIWRESKVAYRVLHPQWEDAREDHPGYWEFFEQSGEMKEMLVAVALLMYGIYRLRVTRRVAGAAPPA